MNMRFCSSGFTRDFMMFTVPAPISWVCGSNCSVREAPIKGHILENVVYLELLRRYENVYVGQLAVGEKVYAW